MLGILPEARRAKFLAALQMMVGELKRQRLVNPPTA
jgi:hypothetical protein